MNALACECCGVTKGVLMIVAYCPDRYRCPACIPPKPRKPRK